LLAPLTVLLSLTSSLACTDYTLTGGVQSNGGGQTGDGGASPGDTGGAGTPDGAADGAADDEGDTGLPAECGHILVYSTEARSDRDNYLGIFDGLPDDPAFSGWDIEIAERATAGPLSDAMLDDRTQLWLMGTDRDEDTPLEDEEVERIVAFVKAGGGLLVGAEHSDTLYSYTEDVNDVAEAFGVRFDGKRDEGAAGSAAAPEDPDASLMAGVATVPIFQTVPLLTLLDGAVRPAFRLQGLVTVAFRDDATRVVFDRSWGGWRDYSRGVGDQETLVAHVASFLDGCDR